MLNTDHTAAARHLVGDFVQRAGKTFLVVRCGDGFVVADFDGEHPQVGIPHLDFDHRHEQQAGQEYWRDEWAGEDEGFPGWAAVFDYIERHPNALES